MSRKFFIAIIALALSAPIFSCAAQNGITSGKIFGVQVGERIALSAGELAREPGEHSGSLVRTNAEKPADIQYLQIYKTPKSHIVTNVEGVSNFRSRDQAMAFANKYMKLLPALAQGFSAATTIDTTGDYPLELKSENWELYVLVRDLKKASGRTGYAVRIGLKPASRTALDYQLFQLVTQEQKEIDKDVRERAVERARANGELKGLR